MTVASEKSLSKRSPWRKVARSWTPSRAALRLYNKKATADQLAAAHLFLRPRVAGDYEGRLAEEDLAACEATLDLIAGRLDALLAQERFTPNFRAEGCIYCPHKALCLKPDLYRTGGKPW